MKCASVLGLLFLFATPTFAETPNIVFIMADDMGYGDPGCYNSKSKIPTPNIDQLAKDGMRFTDAHAPAAVCVPTRYGLITGRYPYRMTRQTPSRIKPDTFTLGALLKRKSYRSICVGKWHLGFANEKSPMNLPRNGGPVDRGFDHYFGIPASLDIPPYYYIENRNCVAPPSQKVKASSSPNVTPIQGAFWRAGGIAPGFKHVDVLPKLTEKAIEALQNHQKKSRHPFFLYLALPAPHTPWLPTKPFLGKSKAGSYGDFTVQVDHTVGRILQTLKSLNVADNTLVIFTSDNGPVWYPQDVKKYDHSSTGVFRGMKGDAFEGGHRMPFIARWPGKIKKGSTSDQLICHTDLMATFADILNVKLPKGAGIDSISFLPALLSRDTKTRAMLIHQSSRRVLSIRHGDWKLIPSLGSGGFTRPSRVKPTKNGPKGQLYYLKTDPGETKNLYQSKPDLVRKLSLMLPKN